MKVMPEFSVEEAQHRLGELFQMVSEGEEVFILGENGAVFQVLQVRGKKGVPKFGSARGMIEMADDFEEPLEDFKDYEA